MALAADFDFGAFFLAMVDVAGTMLGIARKHVGPAWNIPHDTVILELRYLRTLKSVLREGVANNVLLGTLLESLDELVVDTFLDVDTRAGTAALAVVEEDTEIDPGDGIVDISIVEHDVRALSTKLKGHLLEIRSGGGLHDLSANNGATGKGDLVDVHVGGHGGTSHLTESGDDVDNASGETSLFDQLGGEESAEGSLFGGLEDDGVTSGKGGAELPCEHEQGEVPWDDLSADTNLSGQP